MKHFIITILFVTFSGLVSGQNTKYKNDDNTFIIANFDQTKFANIQKILIINGYTIEKYDTDLKIIQTKPKPIAGSVYAYNLKNAIVCYINKTNLIIYSNYTFEYNNLNGGMTNASGKARYHRRKNVGSRIAFDETEKNVKQIGYKYSVVNQ